VLCIACRCDCFARCDLKHPLQETPGQQLSFARREWFQPRSPGLRCPNRRLAGRGSRANSVRSGAIPLDSLYLSFVPRSESLVGVPQINAEAHFSTQPAPPFQDARFSHPYEDKERKSCDLPPPRQRKEARLCEARLP